MPHKVTTDTQWLTSSIQCREINILVPNLNLIQINILINMVLHLHTSVSSDSLTHRKFTVPVCKLNMQARTQAVATCCLFESTTPSLILQLSKWVSKFALVVKADSSNSYWNVSDYLYHLCNVSVTSNLQISGLTSGRFPQTELL